MVYCVFNRLAMKLHSEFAGASKIRKALTLNIWSRCRNIPLFWCKHYAKKKTQPPIELIDIKNFYSYCRPNMYAHEQLFSLVTESKSVQAGTQNQVSITKYVLQMHLRVMHLVTSLFHSLDCALTSGWRNRKLKVCVFLRKNSHKMIK